MRIRPVKFVAAPLALLALAFTAPGALFAQQAHVTGTAMLHLNVSDLDQSLAFYRDVLGMEVFHSTQPSDGKALSGVEGSKLRTAQLKVPQGDFQMELVEWSGTPLKPQHLHIQDPGEIMLAISVRDFNTKLEGAKKLGLKVITHNGELETTGNQPALMIADPTGFIVELNDTDHAKKPLENAWPGPIAGVGVFVTVDDLAKTVAFYNNVFGFGMADPKAAAPANQRIKTLFDNPAIGTFRTARGTFPGIHFPNVTFQEFGGVPHKAVHHGVVDPGGPILPLTVTDFPAAIEAVKANGGIIGTGATSATLAADARGSWIRDPNGALIRLGMPPAPRPANK
jgi:catechol 2,3-dioxygenase-like lactoylglutathione lyase family enzyme